MTQAAASASVDLTREHVTAVLAQLPRVHKVARPVARDAVLARSAVGRIDRPPRRCVLFANEVTEGASPHVLPVAAQLAVVHVPAVHVPAGVAVAAGEARQRREALRSRSSRRTHSSGDGGSGNSNKG